MKRIKKILGELVLTCLMAVCLCLGVSFIKPATNTASAAISTKETTAITNMHIRDSFLLFFTDTNDYANAGSNAAVSATGLTEYNTLDKVQIYTTSGEVVPLWKVVSGMDCYKRYGEANSVAYQLNGTYDGTTIAGVYIPEGTEFPSYEYTNNGGTAKAYVTDKAYTLMSNDTSNATFVTSWTVSNRGTVTEEGTSVTKVHLRATNRLLLFLETSDYSNAAATTLISGKTALTNYNTLDNILVYTPDGEYTFREAVSSATYYNVWGETGSVSYDFKSGFDNTNVTKIVIPAGTEFPSYEYTNNGGAQKAYVTTKNVIYTNNGVGADSTNWSATTFGEDASITNTETTAITNMHIRDSFLLFFTDTNDYANAGSNAAVSATGLTEYNTLDKVQIYTTSGEVVPLWKVVSGMDCYKRYGEANSVAYQLNGTYDGTTIAGVYIPEGTEFPSYEYTNNGGTAKAYVTDKAYTLMSNDTSNATFVTSWTVSNRGTVTEEGTSVTKVHLRATNRLLLFLETSDYSNAAATTLISGKTALTNYNTLDNILVYTPDGEYTFREAVSSATYYNVWGETGSVSYDFKSGFDNTNVTKIVIPAGTEFPSYEYTNNGGAQKAYVTTKNVIYTNNGVGADSTNWSAVTFGAATEETEVPAQTYDTAVTSLEYVNGHVGFYLSAQDYASAANNASVLRKEGFSELNTLTKITVNGTALGDLYGGTDTNTYMQMWGRVALWIPISAPVEGDLIAIPAGTQFPSYSGVSGGPANTYVTTNDITYVYKNSAWVEKVDFTQTAVTASVRRIDTGDNLFRLMLDIVGGDYANAPANSSYNVSKLSLLNTLDYILINDTPLSGLGLTEYFVNLYLEGELAFGKVIVSEGDTITIKKGTQLPSWAFINDGTATCYVTEKEVSYTYVLTTETGDQLVDWSEILALTSIEKADFNDTKEEGNNVLYLYLAENDYGTTEGTVDVNDEVGSLNTLDYIEIDGVKAADCNIGHQAVNYFTRWGAFGLRLDDYDLENEPSYVYIKAGCQIPSLAFAQDNSDLSAYVIEQDTWIVYNDYYDAWDIMTQAPENLVETGDILPANESIANRIFLGWELNGALYKGGTAAPAAGLAKAIYLDYALQDGASIRMADTADESGIRFTAFLQEEAYTAYSEYIQSIGVLVLPLELLGSEAFTVGHSATAVNFYALKEKGFTFVNGVMTARATIHTVRATNYNRDYAARAYVCVNYADGSTDYVYGYFQKENHVRNIYEVATDAYKANEGTSSQRSVLVGYAGKVADLTFDGETFTATADTIGSALTAIQTASIEDGIVSLILASDSESEPLILVNGEPIRDAVILEKVYENNLFTVSFLYETAAGLTFYASDAAMQKFFQDYFELYSMAGKYAVTHSGVSNGPTYQQAWYMNAMAWFKATDLVFNEESATHNATYSAEDYALYYLNNIDVDKNGNVYSSMNDKARDTSDGGPKYTTVTSYYLMNSQGWPLPNMEVEGWEGYHAEFNDNVTDETLLAEMENQTAHYASDYENSTMWTVNGVAVTQTNGVAAYTGTAKTDISNVTGAENAIVYEATGLSYSSYNAPFIELRLLIEDPDQAITDFAIEWQTGGVWYSVTQSEYANNPYDIPNETGMYRSYFPLYTHANYGAGEVVYGNDSSSAKTITGLRVVLLADNTTSNVTVGLDYVRATADSRHSVNGPNYIVALNEYAANHNDLSLVANNITRARRAIMFQLEPLQGKNGLVNLSYLHRHDSYEGVANNFWDIYPAGNLNTDANISFYQALLALAEMEEALAKNGISVKETASIEWHDLSGKEQSAAYNYTAESLRTLAANVKTKIQSTFYNATTGRFAWSVRDVASKGGKAAGSLMDYGFTELNLRAIEAGIASDEQATSIMQWISGARTVSGDKVTGSDIYKAEFAPLTTTVENRKYTSTLLQTGLNESDFTAFYIDKDFGVECQDGGAIMHVSYYDLMARAKVLGVDDAYTRMTVIKDWFLKVQAKNSDAATNGWADFFVNYYGTDDLQGAHGNGAYGLHDEFKEAIMVMATAPKIFLGLEAHYDTLTIAPNLGSNLTYFGMENLSFGGNAYACRVTKDSVTLSGIHRNVNTGLNVTLKLAYTAGQNVYLNGKLLATDAYTEENGYVIVTTDFANLTLQVK